MVFKNKLKQKNILFIFLLLFSVIILTSQIYAMDFFDLTEEQQKVAEKYQQEFNDNQVLRQNYNSQQEYADAWDFEKRNCFSKVSMIANNAIISTPQFKEFKDIYKPYLDYCDYSTFYNTLCFEDASKISTMSYCANPSCTTVDGKEECECLEAKTCGQLIVDNLNLTSECETKKSTEMKKCRDKINADQLEQEASDKINELYFKIEDGIQVVDSYNGHECMIEGTVENTFIMCVDDLLNINVTQIALAKFSNVDADLDDFFQDHDLEKECSPNFDSDKLYEENFGSFLAICNNSDMARMRAYDCINENWDNVYSKKDPSKAIKEDTQKKQIEENKEMLDNHYENIEKEKQETIDGLVNDLEKNLKEMFAGNEELIKRLTEELKDMEDPYDKIQKLREEKKNYSQDSKIQKLKDIYLELGGKNQDLDLILNSGNNVSDIEKNLSKAIVEKGYKDTMLADSGVFDDLKSSVGDGMGWANFAASQAGSVSSAVGDIVYQVKPSKQLADFYENVGTANEVYGWASDTYDNVKFMDKVNNLDIDPNTKDAVKALRVMGSITKNVANYLPPGLSDGVGALGNSVETAAEAVTKAIEYYNSRAKEANVVSNSDYRFLQQNLQQYTERNIISSDYKVKIKIYDPNTSTYFEETGGQMDFKKVTAQDGSEAFYSIPKGSTETFDDAQGTGRLYRYYSPWLSKNRLQIFNHTTDKWEDVKVITQKTPVNN